MYRLLIVDDEAWIRERIKSTIDWEAMNVEVVGEACDGSEALDLTIKLSPQIVITDIRMPGIDGLEFIKRINEAKINAKTIIISGYSDFDYARKAIKLGAFDYILKPVEDENLIDVVKNCITLIDSEERKELWFSILEAKQALQNKAYPGKGCIYEDIKSMDANYRVNNYKLYDLEVLLNNIRLGNKEDALISLEEIIKTSCKAEKNLGFQHLKLVCIDIFNSIFKISMELKVSADDFSEFSYSFLEQLDKIEAVEDALKWLSELVIKCIDRIDKFKINKKRKIIEKALDYINNEYKEQITLNYIAEKLYLNASYFCKIFREETGESFTKYLMKLRVDKAIELMSDPTLKIYEIANLVGYEDVQYFTKMFKTISGVTPMQYREKIK